jgi:ribosome-associated toxin RatA of RatAB toxin-antitoxin module
MRSIEVRAHVRGRSAAEVYQALSELERYAECAEAVRALSVIERTDQRVVSSWDVDFHGGVLRWTEEAFLDPARHVIRFRQIEGDAEHYAGEWGARDEDGGCRLWFSAEFDLGIPSLDMTLGPIGEAALRQNVQSIVTGLLGGCVEFE